MAFEDVYFAVCEECLRVRQSRGGLLLPEHFLLRTSEFPSTVCGLLNKQFTVSWWSVFGHRWQVPGEVLRGHSRFALSFHTEPVCPGTMCISYKTCELCEF